MSPLFFFFFFVSDVFFCLHVCSFAVLVSAIVFALSAKNMKSNLFLKTDRQVGGMGGEEVGEEEGGRKRKIQNGLFLLV